MRCPLFIILLISITQVLYSQNVNVVKFDWLQDLREKQNDTIYVINFWATWCKPCVGELPLFDTVQITKYKKPVKVFLLSLDYIKTIDNKLKPFLQKHKTVCDVLLLNETNYNEWIDKVNTSWSGAIPATLILSPSTKTEKFFEGEVSFKIINQLIKEL